MGTLVIGRRLGERILIGPDIEITVVEVGRGRVRLGIKSESRKSVTRLSAEPRFFEWLRERREANAEGHPSESKQRGIEETDT